MKNFRIKVRAFFSYNPAAHGALVYTQLCEHSESEKPRGLLHPDICFLKVVWN